jgi:uncharacterized protein (TIGR02996 family)
MAKKNKLEPSETCRSEMLRLLKAAKENPWDDAKRLVLAGWLEEHGNEADRARAEIIRLQIDEANGGPWWWHAVDRSLERDASVFVGRFSAFFAGRRVPHGERGLLMVEPLNAPLAVQRTVLPGSSIDVIVHRLSLASVRHSAGGVTDARKARGSTKSREV